MNDPLHTVLTLLGKGIDELEQQLQWANDSSQMSALRYREVEREKEKERAEKERAQCDARRLRERIREMEAEETAQ